jgi:hypothetical protein
VPHELLQRPVLLKELEVVSRDPQLGLELADVPFEAFPLGLKLRDDGILDFELDLGDLLQASLAVGGLRPLCLGDQP